MDKVKNCTCISGKLNTSCPYSTDKEIQDWLEAEKKKQVILESI